MLRDCKRFSAVIALFVALSFIPLCLSDSSVCDRQSRSPAADSFTAAVCDFAGSAALVSAEEIIPRECSEALTFQSVYASNGSSLDMCENCYHTFVEYLR